MIVIFQTIMERSAAVGSVSSAEEADVTANACEDTTFKPRHTQMEVTKGETYVPPIVKLSTTPHKLIVIGDLRTKKKSKVTNV